MSNSEGRLRLRDLPGEIRFVLGIFLVLTAFGYVAALVQVHYQSAGSGEMLPGFERVRERYAGAAEPSRSKIERLLEADQGPFNAHGTMRPAFTTQSRDWEKLTRELGSEDRAKLNAEREGESLALINWVQSGGDRSAYDRDDYFVGHQLAGQPITPDLSSGIDRVKIRTLIQRRCAECHSETGRMERPRRFPLDTYERLKPYIETKTPSQMALPALAQTTHVHLLELSLLFAVTGTLFCLTSIARGLRLVFAPLPLGAQAIDIACWWLARWDAAFVWGILIGGTVAGIGLAIHIVVGLWDLVSTGRAASQSDAV